MGRRRPQTVAVRADPRLDLVPVRRGELAGPACRRDDARDIVRPAVVDPDWPAAIPGRDRYGSIVENRIIGIRRDRSGLIDLVAAGVCGISRHMDGPAWIVEDHAHPARESVTRVDDSVIRSALPLIKIAAGIGGDRVEVILVSGGDVSGPEGGIGRVPRRIQVYILVGDPGGNVIDDMTGGQDRVRPNHHPRADEIISRPRRIGALDQNDAIVGKRGSRVAGHEVPYVLLPSLSPSPLSAVLPPYRPLSISVARTCTIVRPNRASASA